MEPSFNSLAGISVMKSPPKDLANRNLSPSGQDKTVRIASAFLDFGLNK